MGPPCRRGLEITSNVSARAPVAYQLIWVQRDVTCEHEYKCEERRTGMGQLNEVAALQVPKLLGGGCGL